MRVHQVRELGFDGCETARLDLDQQIIANDVDHESANRDLEPISRSCAGGKQSGTSRLKVFPERNAVLALTVNTPGVLSQFAKKIFDGFGTTVLETPRARLTRPTTPVATNLVAPVFPAKRVQ